MCCDTFTSLPTWRVGHGIEATEGAAAQSEDVNRGGAHWLRIVGRAVTLCKADGH
jgi:hypothetical protein